MSERITINRRQNGSRPVNVLCLVKGDQRYVFLFDDAHRLDVFQALGRAASNEDLDFTWYDAAMCSQRLREKRNDA